MRCELVQRPIQKFTRPEFIQYAVRFSDFEFNPASISFYSLATFASFLCRFCWSNRIRFTIIFECCTIFNINYALYTVWYIYLRIVLKSWRVSKLLPNNLMNELSSSNLVAKMERLSCCCPKAKQYCASESRSRVKVSNEWT